MSRGGAGYATGKNAVAICDRCAEKVPYSEIRKDGQYPDMNVCKSCWDPKHPQEYLPDTFDPITLYDPTGDPEHLVAGAYVKISQPWLFAPPQPLLLGVGVGLGSFGFAAQASEDSGDSFDFLSFDVDSFSDEAFDI